MTENNKIVNLMGTGGGVIVPRDPISPAIPREPGGAGVYKDYSFPFSGSTFVTAEKSDLKLNEGTLGFYTSGDQNGIFNWKVVLTNPSNIPTAKSLVSVYFPNSDDYIVMGADVDVWLGDGIDGDPGVQETWIYVGLSEINETEIFIFFRDVPGLPFSEKHVAVVLEAPSVLTSNNSGEGWQEIPFAKGIGYPGPYGFYPPAGVADGAAVSIVSERSITIPPGSIFYTLGEYESHFINHGVCPAGGTLGLYIPQKMVSSKLGFSSTENIFAWNWNIPNPANEDREFEVAIFSEGALITEVGQRFNVDFKGGEYGGSQKGTYQMTYVGYSLLPDGIPIIIFSWDGDDLSDNSVYLGISAESEGVLSPMDSNASYWEAKVPDVIAGMPIPRVNFPLINLFNVTNGSINISEGATFTTTFVSEQTKGSLGRYRHRSLVGNNIYATDVYNWGEGFLNPNASQLLASVTFYAENITQIGQTVGVWFGDGIDGDLGDYVELTYVGYSTLHDGSKIIIFSNNGSLLEDNQEYIAITAYPSKELTFLEGKTEENVPYAIGSIPPVIA